MRPPAMLSALAFACHGPAPQGAVTYAEALDGENVCDATLALTATPYTGACIDCDFAFSITSEVTTERGDCARDPALTLRAPAATETVLAYLSAHDDYEDLLQVGFAYAENPTLAWESLAYTGSDDRPYGPALYTGSGHASFTDTSLTWSVERHTIGDRYFWDDCGDLGVMVDVVATPPSGTVDGSLPCGEDRVDVWSFSASAGEAVKLFVDGPGEPVLWVDDPAGCTRVEASANVDCASSDGRCPYVSLTADVTGVWTAVVAPADTWFATCTGGAYRLHANTTPLLLEDDALRWDVSREAASGTLSLSE